MSSDEAINKLEEAWDGFIDRLEEAIYQLVDGLREIFAPLVEAIKKMFNKNDFEERTDFGETDDCYWVWDVNDNRLAYMYGDYYFGDRKIKVTKDRYGEVVSFEYVDEE